MSSRVAQQRNFSFFLLFQLFKSKTRLSNWWGSAGDAFIHSLSTRVDSFHGSLCAFVVGTFHCRRNEDLLTFCCAFLGWTCRKVCYFSLRFETCGRCNMLFLFLNVLKVMLQPTRKSWFRFFCHRRWCARNFVCNQFCLNTWNIFFGCFASIISQHKTTSKFIDTLITFCQLPNVAVFLHHRKVLLRERSN